MSETTGDQATETVVTIIYPPGCREISDDLNSDELVRRLKTLAHTFQTLGQAEDETTYSKYVPLANHIVEESYLHHSSRDVQLLVACCVADILRIFAPEAPYKSEEQIKMIFNFLITQLGGLKDPKDPAFKRYFYLLENLAYVKSFNMCLELVDCNDIFCSLFSLMFRIVSDEHSGKVKMFMLDVLCPLVTDADFISNELLDLILLNIIDPLKTQRKNSALLAREIISKTSDTLEPYIQQLFNDVLILGKGDKRHNTVNKKIYDLIYELNQISPRILLSVLPQLEFKLKSQDTNERIGSVRLLSRMFSEKGSDLASKHRGLWNMFLARYNDIAPQVRHACVQSTMHFLLNHPELHADITRELKARQHDLDENTRYEVVTAIVSAARQDFNVVAKNETLLNNVKERTRDKVFKIRREALSGLALIYKNYLMDPDNVPQATKSAIGWIRDKILHGYYMQDMQDRLLIERLLNSCLVPYGMETADRMKKLLIFFSAIDDNSLKAFIEIQKNQKFVRTQLRDFVKIHRTSKSEFSEKDLSQQLQTLSRCLPDSTKSMENLKRLSQHLLTDETIISLFERVVQPNVSCKDSTKASEEILKRLGSPIMTNLYYSTVKQLLSRASSVIIDREAVQELAKLVKEILTGGDFLNQLTVHANVAAERSLRLLSVLAFVHTQHFIYTDIVKELLGLTSLAFENTAHSVLLALSYIGRDAPLEESFPDHFKRLFEICKSFIGEGTPKEGKHAIKCLFLNCTNSKKESFEEILDVIKDNLSLDRGEVYCTAIVALGHLAYLMPNTFTISVKNIVSRKIVKELIMKDNTDARADNGEWEDFEDLPLETRCKIEGMKLMARWLTGLKSDLISAQKTFRMLNAFISCKGDLLEGGKPNKAERAALRLGAGCAMLKICETQDVGDVYTLDQFYNLSQLVIDPCKQVRKRFVVKLNKGLSKKITDKNLPIDFMGLFALVGLEEDKSLKEIGKQCIIANTNRRRDYIKALKLSNELDESHYSTLLPDLLITFGITVLAHHTDFKTHDDISMLKKMRAALTFMIEPLLVKNELCGYGFHKSLIEEMKRHRDALNPDDEAANKRLWAICDLALSILVSKGLPLELGKYPPNVKISDMYFTPADDPEFVNNQIYIPAEMAQQQQKKPNKTVLPATSKKPKAVTTSDEDSEDDDDDLAGIGLDQAEDDLKDQKNGSGGEVSQSAVRRGGRKRGRNALIDGDEEMEEEPVEKQPTVSQGRRGRPASRSTRS